MKEVHLQIVNVNTGFCQITYKTKNDLGEIIYYGLQDNGQKFGGIRLMRCTSDYEPSHEIKKIKPEYKFIFQEPTGESKLENLCREFIKNFATAQTGR